jgi:hypothetical protein
MKLTQVRGKVREAMLEYLENRFGIEPGTFTGFELMDNGKGRIFALSKATAEFCARNNIMSTSLPFMRLDGAAKPTSAMLQVFGRHAQRNVLAISRSKAKEFMEGFDLLVESGSHSCSDGYVIITYDGFPLGCGLLRGNDIKNMLPKAKRMSVELF